MEGWRLCRAVSCGAEIESKVLTASFCHSFTCCTSRTEWSRVGAVSTAGRRPRWDKPLIVSPESPPRKLKSLCCCFSLQQTLTFFHWNIFDQLFSQQQNWRRSWLTKQVCGRKFVFFLVVCEGGCLTPLFLAFSSLCVIAGNSLLYQGCSGLQHVELTSIRGLKASLNGSIHQGHRPLWMSTKGRVGWTEPLLMSEM